MTATTHRAAHRAVVALDRWSTLKVISMFSALGLILGPTIGFCFEDTLRPLTDPYLRPVRGILGVDLTEVPVPDRALPPTAAHDAPPEGVPVAPPAATVSATPIPAAPRPAPTVSAGRHPAIVPALQTSTVTETVTPTRVAPAPVSTPTTKEIRTSEPTSSTNPATSSPHRGGDTSTGPAEPSRSGGEGGSSSPGTTAPSSAAPEPPSSSNPAPSSSVGPTGSDEPATEGTNPDDDGASPE